jgi:hypothetical protein
MDFLRGHQSYDLLKRYTRAWVEKYLGNGNNIRDDKWTKGIAVGSKGFVEHVSLLSALLPKAERPRSQETAISFESPQRLTSR